MTTQATDRVADLYARYLEADTRADRLRIRDEIRATERIYRIAACASGCAYHSTVGGTCDMCGGPLTEPRAVSRAGARAILLGGQRYDEGKSAALAWLAAR